MVRVLCVPRQFHLGDAKPHSSLPVDVQTALQMNTAGGRAHLVLEDDSLQRELWSEAIAFSTHGHEYLHPSHRRTFSYPHFQLITRRKRKKVQSGVLLTFRTITLNTRSKGGLLTLYLSLQSLHTIVFCIDSHSPQHRTEYN